MKGYEKREKNTSIYRCRSLMIRRNRIKAMACQERDQIELKTSVLQCCSSKETFRHVEIGSELAGGPLGGLHKRKSARKRVVWCIRCLERP